MSTEDGDPGPKESARLKDEEWEGSPFSDGKGKSELVASGSSDAGGYMSYIIRRRKHLRARKVIVRTHIEKIP